MGKPYPILQERNQSSLPVLEDFEKLQGEKSMVTCVSPRSPVQPKRYAVTNTSSRFVGTGSPKQDILKKPQENSCPPRKMLPGLELQTVRAGDDMQPDAQTVAITLGKKEEVPQVRKQPCPPSTCREQGRHAVLAFRRLKFRGEWHGSTSSEGTGTSKREGCSENRSDSKTITIDNFTVDHPCTELRRPNNGEGKCDETLDSAPAKDCYDGENNGNKEKSTENFSDCMSEVSKGATFARTKRLTDRNQVEYFVDLDCKMSRRVCKVTDYCHLNKGKPKLGPNPLDIFAQRQLGCHGKSCRKNLELTERVTSKTCKDFDTTKETMINNWLIDVSKV